MIRFLDFDFQRFGNYKNLKILLNWFNFMWIIQKESPQSKRKFQKTFEWVSLLSLSANVESLIGNFSFLIRNYDGWKWHPLSFGEFGKSRVSRSKSLGDCWCRCTNLSTNSSTFLFTFRALVKYVYMSIVLLMHEKLNHTVATIFTKVVAKNPNKVAFLMDDKKMTYQEVSAREISISLIEIVSKISAFFVIISICGIGLILLIRLLKWMRRLKLFFDLETKRYGRLS